MILANAQSMLDNIKKYRQQLKMALDHNIKT